MPQTVTLELPDEVIQQAREMAQRLGRSLEDIFIDWIRHGATSENAATLLPGKEYPILSTLGNEDAATILEQYLRTVEEAK